MPVILTVDAFPLGASMAAPVCVMRLESDPAHKALSKKPLGAGRSCRELTTPGVGTVPTREKDFSFESIFHIRMLPSHDPG